MPVKWSKCDRFPPSLPNIQVSLKNIMNVTCDPPSILRVSTAQEIRKLPVSACSSAPWLDLDRKAVKEAFSALTEGRTPTSAQKEFLDLLIHHLTEQGGVYPARFHESPCNDLREQGSSGVFPYADVQRIIAVFRDIMLKATITSLHLCVVPCISLKHFAFDGLFDG